MAGFKAAYALTIHMHCFQENVRGYHCTPSREATREWAVTQFALQICAVILSVAIFEADRRISCSTGFAGKQDCRVPHPDLAFFCDVRVGNDAAEIFPQL
jgi:hypothetical protein